MSRRGADVWEVVAGEATQSCGKEDFTSVTKTCLASGLVLSA